MTSTDLSRCEDYEVLARCGRDPDERTWSLFLARFERRVLSYVLRSGAARGRTSSEARERARDLAQEVYVRLLANDRRALREFKGTSDFAAYAYLARVVRAVVTDSVRREASLKRSSTVVSLDAVLDEFSHDPRAFDALVAGSAESPERALDALLARERIARLFAAAPGGSKAGRDAAIFRLYAVEELTPSEIAALPGFDLTPGAVEKIIRRTRDRLREASLRAANLSA